MAKAKNPKKKIGGPFVAAAVLCNSVVEDADGVVSALRIVDEIRGVLSPDAPADFPSKSNPLEINLFALIIIRRGDAVAGEHDFRIEIEKPNGETAELAAQKVPMPAYPNGSAVVKCKLSMKLHSSGVFWLDVILDKKRLTRMALNIVIQRAGSIEAKT